MNEELQYSIEQDKRLIRSLQYKNEKLKDRLAQAEMEIYRLERKVNNYNPYNALSIANHNIAAQQDTAFNAMTALQARQIYDPLRGFLR